MKFSVGFAMTTATDSVQSYLINIFLKEKHLSIGGNK